MISALHLDDKQETGNVICVPAVAYFQAQKRDARVLLDDGATYA